MKRILYSIAALLLVLAKLPAEESNSNEVRRSCCIAAAAPAEPLTDKSLYQIRSSWTNDAGQAIQLSSLRGRPQIVVMFFASCQLTCPLIVSQVKQFEATLPEETRAKIGFTLVSFDSVRDTPDALKNYRAGHSLSADNWTLLSGSPDGVLDLAALLGVKFKQDAQGNFSHSNLITLLNAEGEIVYQQVGLNPDDHDFARRIEQLQTR
jgi:protein SCO1/2